MTRSKRSPNGRMPVHMAILRMHMGDAFNGQLRIASGERSFAGYKTISRVPNYFQKLAGHVAEHLRRLSRRADVTRVLVLQTDDDMLFFSNVRQVTQSLGNGFGASLRINRSPIRENTNNAGSKKVRNLNRAFGQARLILESVLRTKHIMLKAAIQIGRIWQNAFQQRRGDGDHLDPSGGQSIAGAFQFVSRQVYDVFAIHDTQFGSGHANFPHNGNRFGQYGREFVCDRGDRDLWFKGGHRYLYTCTMFFRREVVTLPTFSERIDKLKKAGFIVETMADGRAKIIKHGVAAVIGDEGKGHATIEKSGVLMNGELGTLLSGGYQMFLSTSSGKRYPAQAEQLKALHEFEMDVKEALELTDLYNTSLGTTSRNHVYDRVANRENGGQTKPWMKKF